MEQQVKPHSLTWRQISSSIAPMATSRDELFCKLAIRQGAWSKEEAILFLQHYRSDGQGQRFGSWAVEQGAIDQTLAARIEHAINQRNEGTVDDNVRRVPSRGGQGAAKPSKMAARRQRGNKTKGSGLDFNRRPVHSSIVVACGIGAIIGVFVIIFKIQGSGTPDPIPVEVATEKNEDSKKAASGTSNPTPKVATLAPDELKAMANKIQLGIGDARGFQRDGKAPLGLKHLNKLREEMVNDGAPPEQLALIDTEIQELSSFINEIYTELLEELNAARAAKNTEDIEDALFQIETQCGASYRTRAEKEGS